MNGQLRLEWKLAVRESDLDSTAKLVAFALETWMNRETGYAYPARDTIAAAASLSTRATEKALTRLEAGGFLTVQRSKGRTVNHYWAAFPNSEPDSPLLKDNSEPRSPSTANHDHATANVTPANSEPRSPELVINPSLNPSTEPVNGNGHGHEEENDLYDLSDRLLSLREMHA